MESHYLISKSLSNKVLMIGVYYKHHAPGGMASVIQYYEKYFAKLRYISSWRNTSKTGKLMYAVSSYLQILFLLMFDKRIKVLHIHSAADRSFFRKARFIRLGKRFNKKIILHIHASRFKDFYREYDNKEQIKKILRQPDRIAVLSQSWQEWFTTVIGIETSKLTVLNNIVDYPRLIEKKRIEKYLKLLFLGEIGQRKGIFDILDVLVQNKEYFQNKIFLRIGGNGETKKLVNEITANGLNSFVTFEGWVSGEKKTDLLNEADIYILPSYNEGLPIGILEAMSYGCAIITSPVGGIPDIITSGYNGLLVNPGNKKEIYDALSYFTENKERTEEFGAINRIAVQKHLPEFVMKQLCELYISVLPK